MFGFLHRIGVRSDFAYAAGFLSIAASIAAWFTSKKQTDDPEPKSDRWGIYVGLWAPTFIAIGNGLKDEERTRLGVPKRRRGVKLGR